MKYTTLFTAILFITTLTTAQTSSQIEIDLKNTEPTPLQTSEYADVWLEVKNTGTASANDVEVSFTENYPFTVVRGDKKNWSVGELVPGEEYQIHLQTRVDANAVQGNNTLDFNVDTGQIQFEEKVPVEVRSDRNVLAIQQIEFPAKAAPGSTNTMQLKLENLADAQIKNIQVGLDLSDELPMATSESSEKNLAGIEAGQTKTINFTLNIDESAENSVYKLPIQISFENQAGTEFTQSSTTGVNVGGEPRLEAAINTEEELVDGQTTDVTFRLVNRGHGSADFVSMKLQDTDQVKVIGKDDAYIGSMDSDDFQTASFQVNIDAQTESLDPDQVRFPIQLSYTDSEGETVETQNVTSEVYSQERLQSYGIGSGGSILPLVAVLVVVLAGGIIYWRRRKG